MVKKVVMAFFCLNIVAGGLFTTAWAQDGKWVRVRDAAQIKKYLRPKPAANPSSAKSLGAAPKPKTPDKKLAAFPKGTEGVWCNDGGCGCSGYDDCNTLISACAQVGADWDCLTDNSTGGCISGECS